MLIYGFFPRRKPFVIYEGIVLWLCIILREEIVREWRGSYSGCVVGCIPSSFIRWNKERTGNFYVDVAHIGWTMYICVFVFVSLFYVLFRHLFYYSTILLFYTHAIHFPPPPHPSLPPDIKINLPFYIWI